MSSGSSGETIVIESGNPTNVDVVEPGGGEVELFPEDRADGPLSGVFRAARRFRERIDSKE